MKKIKNNYIKKLVFIFDDEGTFVINSKEIKTVPDELAEKLCKNTWIEEINEVIKKGRSRKK